MITLQNVSKVFGTGVAGLSDINLQIDKGEFVFLVGHTGSGKTTLLRMLIKEVVPTTGSVIVGGWDLNKLPGHKIPHLRKKIGVVFQDLKLLMDRTIFENIMLPLQVSGINSAEAKNRAEELLEHVGISVHRDKFPIQLSGGELQRAAIARALTLSPDILLADEPTGNLDVTTAFGIVSLLSKINQHGTTIIMATHNMEIVEKLGNRVVVLEKGLLVKDEKAKGDKKETQESATPANVSVDTKAVVDKKELEEEKDAQGKQEEHKKHEHHAKTPADTKHKESPSAKTVVSDAPQLRPTPKAMADGSQRRSADEGEKIKEREKNEEVKDKEGEKTSESEKESVSAGSNTATADKEEKPKKKKFSFFNRKKE